MSAPARRPRYGRFLATGALLGVLAAVVLASLAPQRGGYDPSDLVLYLSVVLALVGALLGGLVAVLLERPGPDDAGGDRASRSR